jgi:hypothetical protein
MTIYPVEFQRRLEQKWARRIDQIIAVTGNATPPRDANDDDEENEEHDRTRRGTMSRQSSGNPNPTNSGQSL